MIYDDILDGILITEGLGKTVPLSYSFDKTPKNENDQIKYLLSLRTSAKYLWNSYQNQKVNTDYSTKNTQNCYLLRYFLPYSNLLTEELNKLKKNQNINVFGNKNKLNNIDNLTVSFFGCGPAPEIIGLLRHLKSSMKPSIETLEVNLFDIYSKSWKHSIDIVTKHVMPNFDSCYKERKIKSYTADFSSSKFWTASNSTNISKSNLVVFQNCLNEINDDLKRNQVVENIGFIIKSLSKNSIIIFIDQSIGKYNNSSDYILESIQSLAIEKSRDLGVFQLHQDNELNCRESNKKIPEMVNNYLYYVNKRITKENDGLILRNKVEYSSLIIERQ